MTIVMKAFRYILIIFILLVRFFVASGQYFIAGQDPARYKWNQINTSNYQVIYPEQFEKEACRIANQLEKAYSYIGASLEHQSQKKYSVILHTSSMVSNAFVATAPLRSEFYSMPDQEILPVDWFEHLILHEGRHMIQIDKINEELPKIIKLLLGESATALCIGAYIPFWLIEGDAVCNETALSYSGRGRFPGFRKQMRAQLLEKGHYSYDKAYLGSYKDFVPNYYQLGYLMTAGARENYGSELWENVFQNVGKRPLSLNPLEQVLKKETGGNKTALYNKIIAHYKTRWIEEDQKLNLTPYTTISKQSPFYTNYRYPQPLNDGSVIALKSGIAEAPRIVQIDPKGNEKSIFVPVKILANSFSLHGNQLVWIESLPNVRWSLSDRSVVRFLKIGDHSTKNVVFKEKLFAPTISPDGKSFAVVSVDETGKNSLQVRAINDGKLLHSFHTEKNEYFTGPSWSENGKALLVIAVGSNGKRLIKINRGNGSKTVILQPTFTEIRKPVEKNGFIYFIGGKTGIDNLFRLDSLTGKMEQLSSVRFGMDDPIIHNNKLYYSNYTSNGYQLAYTPLNQLEPERISSLTMDDDSTVQAISSQEPVVVNFSPDTIAYISKPYRKGTHLFNFHSRIPTYWANEYADFLPGLSFQSQNLLSTAITEVGFGFNPSEKTTKWKTDFTYYGFYPVLDLFIEYGDDKENYFDQEDNQVKTDHWQETNLNFNVSVPLNFTFAAYYRKLEPKISYEYSTISRSNRINTSVHSIQCQLTGYNLLRTSSRDLYSKWGQLIRFQFANTPYGEINFGNIWSLEGWFYFPGLMKHHSLMTYTGIQHKNSGQYLFRDKIRFARGYISQTNDELSTYGLDYRFPIAYPDWNLGKWFYIKRLKGGLFVDRSDFTQPVRDNGVIKRFKASRISLGGELRMDFNPLRLLAPIDLGGRGIWLNDEKQMRWEFLFLIHLY